MHSHSLSDHIERSLSLYRSHFLTYSKYIGLSIIPPIVRYIAAIGIGFITLNTIVTAFLSESLSFNTVVTPILLTTGVNFIIGLFALWISIAFQRIIFATMKDEQSGTLRTRFAEATRLFFPTLGVSILYTMYTVGPILIFAPLMAFLTFGNMGDMLPEILTMMIKVVLIAGIVYGVFHMLYFGIRLFFALFEVILSGSKIKDAFKTSMSLTCGNWTHIFLVLFVTTFALSILVGILENIFTGLGTIIPYAWDNSIFNVIMLILSLFLFQILTIVTISLYDSAKNPRTQPLKPEFEPTTKT